MFCFNFLASSNWSANLSRFTRNCSWNNNKTYFRICSHLFLGFFSNFLTKWPFLNYFCTLGYLVGQQNDNQKSLGHTFLYYRFSPFFLTFSLWSVHKANAFSALASLAANPNKRLVILSISSTWSLYFSHSLGWATCITFTVIRRPTSSLVFVSVFKLVNSALNTSNLVEILEMSSSFFFLIWWLLAGIWDFDDL